MTSLAMSKFTSNNTSFIVNRLRDLIRRDATAADFYSWNRTIRARRNGSEQAQQLLQHCFSRLAHGLTVPFSLNRANRFSPEILSMNSRRESRRRLK